MADPRKVGVQFIVMGEQEFAQALDMATREFDAFNDATAKATQNAEAFGSGWQRAFQSFRSLGATPKEAMGGMVDATLRGVDATKLLRENQDKLFTAMQQMALQGKSWNEIQDEMNALAGKNANAHTRLTESAVASSRAFFALTLAGFGLMEIERQLEQAFGDDLPVAFERSVSGLNQIASFGSAGAFIGGTGGAIGGGIVGIVLALTSAALQLDPAIQQLNQSLDNLADKERVADTLAKILDVAEEDAEILLEAARKNQDFAATLEEMVKGAEPVPPAIAAITAAADALNIELGELPDVGEALNKLLQDIGASIVMIGTAIEVTKQSVGKNGIIGHLMGEDAGVNQATIWSAVRDFYKQFNEELAGTPPAAEDTARAIAQANRILADQEDIADRVTDALHRMNDALDDAAFREEQLAQKTSNAYAAAQAQYGQAVSNAARERGQSIAQAEENLTNRIADLWLDLQNKVTDINQDLADKVSDINMRLGNQIADIQAQLALRIQNIQQDLANKERDIQQDLANKRAQLAQDYRENLNKINLDIKQAAKDLADELYEIERTRIEAIEALAFNTHEQLMTAQTDHDRDRIIRRAQFEQSQIDQTANDARTDALREHEQKLQQFEIEKQLAKENFDYELRLAQLLAEQKIAQARMVAAQQEQQARDSAELQIQQAQRQAAQQLAIAQREQQQALALAERRHQEELAVATRNYQQQVANARQAEMDKISDARAALNARNIAIAQSHEMERAQIERTRQKAIQAYLEILAAVKAIMDAIVLAETHLVGFANAYQDFIDDPLGLKGGNSQFTPIIPDLSKVPGGREGLDMTVPQGYPNDSFMIRASSGERVTVTPANTTTNNARTQVNNISINGGDTEEVRRVVRETLSEAAWGNG